MAFRFSTFEVSMVRVRSQLLVILSRLDKKLNGLVVVYQTRGLSSNIVVEYPDCSSSVAAVVHMPRRWRDHTKRESPTGFFADYVK